MTERRVTTNVGNANANWEMILPELATHRFFIISDIRAA